MVRASASACYCDAGRFGTRFRYHHLIHDDQVSRFAGVVCVPCTALDVCNSYCLSFKSDGKQVFYGGPGSYFYVPESSDPGHRDF